LQKVNSMGIRRYGGLNLVAFRYVKAVLRISLVDAQLCLQYPNHFDLTVIEILCCLNETLLKYTLNNGKARGLGSRNIFLCLADKKAYRTSYQTRPRPHYSIASAQLQHYTTSKKPWQLTHTAYHCLYTLQDPKSANSG
jgi:hypothetical protein